MTRTDNVLRLPTKGGVPEERPIDDREKQRRSRSQILDDLPRQGMLSSDPRFLDRVRRALDAAPRWEPSTRSSNARVLAIGLLGLAALHPISELIRFGNIEFLDATTLGSAVLLFFSAACWRFSRANAQARNSLVFRGNDSNTDCASAKKPMRFDQVRS